MEPIQEVEMESNPLSVGIEISEGSEDEDEVTDTKQQLSQMSLNIEEYLQSESIELCGLKFDAVGNLIAQDDSTQDLEQLVSFLSVLKCSNLLTSVNQNGLIMYADD